MQIQQPPLAAGEIYLCGIADENGDIEHTVLLPGDSGRATWQAQMDWAKSIGGDLPTRVELAIAFAKKRDLFERAAYWSNEEDTDDPGWAWCQGFNGGLQLNNPQHDQLRARAVRRFKN